MHSHTNDFFLFLYPLVTSLKLSNMIKDELPFYSSLSFSRHTKKKKKRRFKEEATNEHVLYLNNGCISLKFPRCYSSVAQIFLEKNYEISPP